MALSWIFVRRILLRLAAVNVVLLPLLWRVFKLRRERLFLENRTQPKRSPVVVITGAGSGIGRGLALYYARRGARLVLAGRTLSKLHAVATECQLGVETRADGATAEELSETEAWGIGTSGGASANLDARVYRNGSTFCEVLCVRTDVTEEDDCAHLMRRAVETFGAIDILILNAGVGCHLEFEEADDLSVYRELMDVNYFGYVNCTKHAFADLKASHGQIVVVSSLSGEMGLPYRSAYCGSKFAVTGFFESLRTEISEDDVHITIVCPPSVKTGFRDHAFGIAEESAADDETDTRMSVETCVETIVRAADMGVRKVYFPLGAYLAVYVRPFFPDLVDWFVKRKARL